MTFSISDRKRHALPFGNVAHTSDGEETDVDSAGAVRFQYNTENISVT
jgi:hypothetical protein